MKRLKESENIAYTDQWGKDFVSCKALTLSSLSLPVRPNGGLLFNGSNRLIVLSIPYRYSAIAYGKVGLCSVIHF